MVSDDIVPRLRDIASLRGNMSGNVIPLACNDAADEIERLRADRDRWRKRALWEHAGYCTVRDHKEGTCEDYIVFCDGGDFAGATK